MKITIISERILGNISSPRGIKTPQFIMYDKIKKPDTRKKTVKKRRIKRKEVPRAVKKTKKSNRYRIRNPWTNLV